MLNIHIGLIELRKEISISTDILKDKIETNHLIRLTFIRNFMYLFDELLFFKFGFKCVQRPETFDRKHNCWEKYSIKFVNNDFSKDSTDITWCISKRSASESAENENIVFLSELRAEWFYDICFSLFCIHLRDHFSWEACNSQQETLIVFAGKGSTNL